jgi:hypothetical protein
VAVDGTAILATGDLGDGTHPNQAGHDLYFAAVAAVIDAIVPVPTNFAASVPALSTGTLLLTWDEDVEHDRWELAQDGGAATDITAGVTIAAGVASYTLTELPNGVSVALSLVAFDAEDNESEAASTDGTPLDMRAPTLSEWTLAADGVTLTTNNRGSQRWRNERITWDTVVHELALKDIEVRRCFPCT